MNFLKFVSSKINQQSLGNVFSICQKGRFNSNGLRRMSSKAEHPEIPLFIQKFQRFVSICESNIKYGISRAAYIQDLVIVSPPYFLKDIYRAASLKTNCESPPLEQRLDKLMMYNLELLCFAYVGDRRSVVSILLSHEHARDIFFHPKSRQLHGLAMKMQMLEDEMSICKIMTLYSIEGCSLQSIENIFRTSKTKGRLIYNHMISVYGKHYAEDADRLFLEMVKTIRPNGYTFRYLLEAWTIACDPERTLKVFQSMKIYGVEPDSVHYGAIVDCYARMRTPYYIHMAILFLKEHPIAQGQYAFNTILNRCVPQEIASSKEEMEEIEETIKLAQDMVDHFDEKGFMYAVLEKTYWRLENHGLKWPWTVSKTRGE